ncbi:MAG TPA: T9SS type A sorting domain-containing protein, partial [Flavisolibacter sp.]|nr:T9SS type A sorting domain-containing protein [Flavisolibacter sp.]
SQGETYIQSDFWSLPVSGMTGTINSNTKAGFGASYDGVPNGASNPAPAYGISEYLTDGIKGLNIGTCIANLPAGSVSFLVQNIQPSSIGDGIPDILVTQVADPPSGSYDRYEFTDQNGVRVGNYLDIIFTNIAPVANWTADFYDVVNNPMTLQAGFTRTDRAMRLWAADLSELGITAANYSQIRNFKINLSGNSDVAFVAYNNQSFNFQGALPVHFEDFTAQNQPDQVTLNWHTSSEKEAGAYLIERSRNGADFQPIGTRKAFNRMQGAAYTFTDPAPLSGTSYYRIRQEDLNKTYAYSAVVKVNRQEQDVSLRLYPNPAHSAVQILHPYAGTHDRLALFNTSGALVRMIPLAAASRQTTLSVHGLPQGIYQVKLEQVSGTLQTTLVVH